jgi:predicted DNA-binding transcriptional regulator YafY
MKIMAYIERINNLHKKIKAKKTGTPSILAAQLHISERCLYSFLDELKIMGAPIAYCKKSESYYYTRPYKMNASLELRDLSDDEMEVITGGSSFLLTAFFVQWQRGTL